MWSFAFSRGQEIKQKYQISQKIPALNLFMHAVTVKPQKTEHNSVTKFELYQQVTAKCSMLAMQNAPMGAFCNASLLHLVIIWQEYIYIFSFKRLVFRGSLQYWELEARSPTTRVIANLSLAFVFIHKTLCCDHSLELYHQDWDNARWFGSEKYKKIS